MENILGHVSVRDGADTMLVRCRGPRERGLRLTTISDVRRCTFDGTVTDDPDGNYSPPKELPIHAQLYRHNPAVRSVVHAHPPAVLIGALADLEIRPVFGAYNIPAFRMAQAGVPIWPRSALVTTTALAEEMVAAMGDHNVCVLRGHGIAVVGQSIQQATVRAIDLNTLYAIHLQLARLGVRPERVGAEDLSALPDLGTAFNDTLLWDYYVAAEQQQHLAITKEGETP